MEKSAMCRILALTLCLSAAPAFAVTNFTETFSTNAANWRYADGNTPLTWFSSGGPGGAADAYVSVTNFSFAGLNDGDFALFARGQNAYGSSGGAFVGNWITSHVYRFSMDVRHNLGVPARFGIRIAKLANYPAANIIPDSFVPSGQWTRIVIPISPDIVGVHELNYEGPNTFENIFTNVGNLQPLMYVPDGYGHTSNATYSFDLDNVAILVASEPGESPGAENFATNAPTYDRWMYEFNLTPPLGNRAVASTFSTDDPRFDWRDAQVYVAFALTNQIPSGLGAAYYEILSCRVELTMSAPSEENGMLPYDDTQDAWETYLNPTNDPDAGRPMELFGAGWRGTNTAWTFGEDGPFPLPPNWQWDTNVIWKEIRNVYALGLKDGAPVDVSNSPDPDGSGTNGFDPVVFAIGKANLDPGDNIPEGTTFSFDVDVANPNVQAYLKDSLNDGIVGFVLATLHQTTQEGGGVYPKWDQKETVVGTPPAIEITYRLKSDIEIGLSGGARVARWPLAAERTILESTTNLLAGSGTWRPAVVLTTTNETHVEAVLPTHSNGNTEIGNTWFLRLRQP